jgi:hypothetical protein
LKFGLAVWALTEKTKVIRKRKDRKKAKRIVDEFHKKRFLRQNKLQIYKYYRIPDWNLKLYRL